jgi:hypothetical protein
MTTRTKIASQSIEGSVLTLSHYGEADESGKQHVAGTVTYDLAMPHLELSMVQTLAAVGLGTVIASRYNRANITDPDVPAIATSVWEAVCNGTWSPGRKESEAEASDLETALAEVTGTPVHVIQQHFAEDMQKDTAGNLIRTKNGKTLRLFNKSYQARLAADPEVAVVLARMEREKAQARIAAAKRAGASAGLVKGLFGSPEQSAAAE